MSGNDSNRAQPPNVRENVIIGINQRQGGAMEAIHEVISHLTKANVSEVMAQLEALLEALPADTASDSDARLRHDIEVLLAGYKAGTPRQRPRPSATN